MSIKSWRAEFYPCSAKSAAAKKDPIGHSLRKWIGLLPKNLKKHGVVFSWGEGKPIILNEDTCALCVIHHDKIGSYCAGCPLMVIQGNRDCDDDFGDDGDDEVSPYWLGMRGNPRPMIEALKKAQKKFGTGAKKAGKKSAGRK